MQRYCYFIISITIITGGTPCTRIHSHYNHKRSESNPQARDRIHKPQYNAQTNEHSADNYHELKNENHKPKYAVENLNQLNHQKGNGHKLKHFEIRKRYPDVKHSKHNKQSKHSNKKSHRNRNFSKPNDKDDEMTNMQNGTKHEKPDVKFPKTYHATGLLTLPYDGIMEPFEIWYVEHLNMSRIDYYHGVDKTFQRGDLEKYGAYIKEIPKHKTKVGDNNKHSKSCWYEEGNKYDVVRPQSIVPMDLSHFKIVGEEYKSGTLTMKLRRDVKMGNLKNTYTLWVSKDKPHQPIRYETEGFDLLLRGPYDHYYLDYITFNDWSFNYTIMEIPKGSWCQTKVKHTQSRYFVNPMSEFVHNPHEVHKHHTHIEKEFKKYKHKHGKSYKDDKEHSKRRNIYRHNARYIRSKNRARLNYTLAVNDLADLTPEEFRAMDDLLNDEGDGFSDFMKDQFPHSDEVPVVNYTEPSQPLPENLDWREYGIVSPIRGQSMCGSCWAFSTAGMLEGAYKIATGKDIQFSAQMLVDCTYGFKNYGCRGGWPWRAMQWVIRNGIATYQSYGRYLAQEGLCHCGPKDNCTILHPNSFADIPKANKTAMMVNLATYGPVSVGINSTPKSFKFYRDGVYDDFDCDDAAQHTLLLVGYGKESHGSNYWIIKNSWGPYWGRQGYMKISNDVDVCGILSSNGVVANFRNSSRGFPFETMKKVVTPYHGKIEDHMKYDGFKPIFKSIPFQ